MEWFVSNPEGVRPMNFAKMEEYRSHLVRLGEWLAMYPAMRQSVRSFDESSVWLDVRCILKGEVFFAPFSFVFGRSVLGMRVTVGPCSIIEEATVGDRVEIGERNTIRRATIGARTKIPYDAELVDVVIGTDTNVARGVTVSNFDGLEKHTTMIGNGCFIGTDVNLVPPLTIGNEVRIFPKMLVISRTPIPDHAWVKEAYENGKKKTVIVPNSSFKIPGHWRWILARNGVADPKKVKTRLQELGARFRDTNELVKFLKEDAKNALLFG